MRIEALLLVGTALLACGGAERDETSSVASREKEQANGTSGEVATTARGPGRGGGPGGTPGPVDKHPRLSCAFGKAPLSDATLAGVREALADEWKAEATYDTFSKRFGQPFPRLERAEERHADLLIALLTAHTHDTPSRPELKPVDASDVADACTQSLEAEKLNVAMYDMLLAAAPEDDVRCVYEHLRMLSADRHIPALERCAGGRP